MRTKPRPAATAWHFVDRASSVDADRQSYIYVVTFTLHGGEPQAVSAACACAMDRTDALARFKMGRLETGEDDENITVAGCPATAPTDQTSGDEEFCAAGPSHVKSANAARKTKPKRRSRNAAPRTSDDARSDPSSNLAIDAQSTPSAAGGTSRSDDTDGPMHEGDTETHKTVGQAENDGKAGAVPPDPCRYAVSDRTDCMNREQDRLGSAHDRVSAAAAMAAGTAVETAAETSAQTAAERAAGTAAGTEPDALAGGTTKELVAAARQSCDGEIGDSEVSRRPEASEASGNAAADSDASGSAQRQPFDIDTSDGHYGDIAPSHAIEKLITSLKTVHAEQVKSQSDIEEIIRAMTEEEEITRDVASQLDDISVEEKAMSDARDRARDLEEELRILQRKVEAHDSSASTRSETVSELDRRRSESECRRRGLKRQLEAGQDAERKRRAIVGKMHDWLQEMDSIDCVGT